MICKRGISLWVSCYIDKVEGGTYDHERISISGIKEKGGMSISAFSVSRNRTKQGKKGNSRVDPALWLWSMKEERENQHSLVLTCGLEDEANIPKRKESGDSFGVSS